LLQADGQHPRSYQPRQKRPVAGSRTTMHPKSFEVGTAAPYNIPRRENLAACDHGITDKRVGRYYQCLLVCAM